MPGYSSDWFNAHHSPLGAFATFTLGNPGSTGGLGLGLARPADEPFYIGFDDDRGRLHALPFFDHAEDAETSRFDSENPTPPERVGPPVVPIPKDQVTRDFQPATDTWQTGNFTLTVLSPLHNAPDPQTTSKEEQKTAYCPAVLVQLTYDNTQGSTPRTVFFGYQGKDPYDNLRRIETSTLVGFGQGTKTAVCALAGSMSASIDFTPGLAYKTSREENRHFIIAATAMLFGTIPPGEKKTFTVAIAFYRDEVVTTGLPARYLYTTLFYDIEEVCNFSLNNLNQTKQAALAHNQTFAPSHLSPARKFLLAHALRSYYGATQLLVQNDGTPLWVVNEGEYRMMNTFDLTVDHLFFETHQNPWVVKNVLRLFADRYSYQDTVRFPDDPTDYPGGISFTHDMGVGNQFSRPGYSSYELAGLKGCFSYMTQEQLVNWVCTLTHYAVKTQDWPFVQRLQETVAQTLTSLENRDHPDPSKRDGLMSLDSSRCQGGAEITTYDSLDASLSQARNNVYLGVKTWAAYLGLELLFTRLGRPAQSAQARHQADKAAQTVASALKPDGTVPAVIGEGVESVILPAIEGLVFPLEWGFTHALDPQGPYANLLKTLETHLKTALRQGKNHFPDGAWKLSSTSENSWLSKIFLNQHVTHRVFGVSLQDLAPADQAHADWLTSPSNAYWAFSDQIISGVAQGSKYYPRGVTAWLWTQNSPQAQTKA